MAVGVQHAQAAQARRQPCQVITFQRSVQLNLVVVALEELEQRGGRLVGDQLAGAHDRHPIAEFLGHIELVRRQHDRLAFFLREPADPLLHRAGGLDVKAQRRLVEQHDGRVGDQGAGDGDLLLHAARELADRLVLALPQFQLGEQAAGALRRRPGRPRP